MTEALERAKKPKKGPKNHVPAAAKMDVPTNDEILQAWNGNFNDSAVPLIKTVSPARRKAFLSIYNSQGPEQIMEAIHLAKNSKFIIAGTFFSFDWFFKKANFIKVLEGNYTDKNEIKNSVTIQDRFNRLQNELNTQ